MQERKWWHSSVKQYVIIIVLENQRTVAPNCYTTQCLSKMIAEWKKKHPQSKNQHFLLYQENAPAHTAAKTVDFLATESVWVLPHPACSPDLAPYDYLFPKAKGTLCGCQFSSDEEALAAYFEATESLPIQSREEAFTNWLYRMQRCTDVHGDYFQEVVHNYS